MAILKADRIYLDHVTTTPLSADVRAAMEPFLGDGFGSPASLHTGGLRARDALARARTRAAELINAESPENIIFTSSGTEAANLAVKGAAWAPHQRGKHIVLTATEHPAVVRSVEFLEQQGFSATQIPVDRQGLVDPEAVRSALRPDTFLVCVHQATHDLGTLQPLEAISNLVADAGPLLFVDATAGAGWSPLDVQQLPIDLLCLSPHHFYGPKGVGILYRHRRARLAPWIHGGNQEGGLRAGTENIPAIVGAGAAAGLAQRDMETRTEHVSRLQSRLLSGLSERIPLVKLNGPPPGPQRLPHHLNLSLEFLEGEGLTLALDLQGLAIHSGPVCLTGTHRLSPGLVAIGLSPAMARASILVSPGADTTETAVDQAIELIASTTGKLREMAPLWEAYQVGQIASEITGRAK